MASGMINPGCIRALAGEIQESEPPGFYKSEYTASPSSSLLSIKTGFFSLPVTQRNQSMVVMKFGGSSVESAKAIQRVASIVRDQSGPPPVVVVSAMGKTTDRLLAIAHLYADGSLKFAGQALAKLRHFHLIEASYLARGAQAIWLDNQLCGLFEELDQVLCEVRAAGSLTPRLSDAVLSFGERFSSVMVTAGFRQMGIDAVHLDARKAIVTDGKHSQAATLFIETNALLRRKVSTWQVTVMGGFIGATEDGVPTTLGRGGSDYTAAIVGAALAVDEIQIWTDVDGMLTCDPRVVSGAHCLRSISYAEAEQMAKAGAKVLHPATVLPAIRQGIPIVIRNSRNPGAAGTRIVRENPSDGAVMSIACRSGIALLQVMPRNTPVTGDFGNEIWDAFQKAGVQFDLIATTSKEISLVVDEASLTPEFVKSLSALAEVEVQESRALVTLVGHNASRNSSNLARASQQLRKTPGGAVLAWCSDSRFAFVVAADALNPAAEALHNEFFGQPDSALFDPNRACLAVEDQAIRSASHRTSEKPVTLFSALTHETPHLVG
jgi:aspartate kinase